MLKLKKCQHDVLPFFICALFSSIKKKLFLQQILISLVLILFCLFISIDVALSAFLGAVTAITVSAIFAYFSFRYFGARNAKRIMSSIFIGQGCKMLMTIILFASIVYYLPNLNISALLLSFVIVNIYGVIAVSYKA